MIKYIIKRLLLMIPVLLGVTIVVFTINFISPGDPVYTMLGVNATDETVAMTRAELGLDQPYLVQLVTYVKNIVTKLDFGTSYSNKQPVFTEIIQRFPVTFRLGILSVLFSVIIGIPLGVVSATRQYSILDYAATFLSLIGAAMPGFWISLIFIIVFALKLGWVPVSGLDSWKGWILPVVATGITPVATIMRTTRSSMLEVIRQDYIRTVRAKGQSEFLVIMDHALKNSLIPVVTVVGVQLGMVFGGVLVIEAVFAIPGLGMLLKNAISSNDYPVIQGCVLFCAIVVSLMNLLVDIVYAFIDPRIKAQYRKTSGTGGRKQPKKARVA